MLSVCLYCGKNKSKALDECGHCLKAPNSHRDIIHSIILSHSEDEPYLNFLTLDEIDNHRELIRQGIPFQIGVETFREAEDAYSAVRSMHGPQAIEYFSTISQPVLFVILMLFIAFFLFGT